MLSQVTAEPTPTRSSPLTRLDAWVAANPWHPRILPFIVYIAFLFIIDQGRTLSLYAYPVLYALQCGLVLWLLYRYSWRQRLTPELTLRFHWLAVPTGLALCWAWIALGELTIALFPRLDASLAATGQPHYFQLMLETSPALAWVSLGLRLLGMTLLVPMFEELFTRSAMLRGLHHARPTGIGVVQVAQDIPIVGEWLHETRLGRRAAELPSQFTRQLVETPVGHLTLFGVFASTLIFMLNHIPRDYAGCIACGVVWCLLLGWTNRPSLSESRRLGLGPIIWSHGITNAALWAWCVYTGDWQWL